MVELYLHSPYVFIHNFTVTADCRLLRGEAPNLKTGKVGKLSLRFYAMKACGGVDV
jgi:hypothetical protein